MTETREWYIESKEQRAFLDALRAACAPPGLPILELADWEPKARAVDLQLRLRSVGGILVLGWEEVGAGAPEAGGGEATKGK